MDYNLLGLAFSAGLVAALNPCGFAMLPAYLALVVRGEDTGHAAALARALAATVAMAVGFLLVFGAFGLLTVSAAATVHQYLPYLTVAVGVTLVVLGGWLLAGRALPGAPKALTRNAGWAPDGRLTSMFGYGIGYAVASLSCTIGPFLAVTGAASRGGSMLGSLAVYAAYAAGFTVLVGVLAVATALTKAAVVDRMRRILPYVNRIGGVVLVVVGLYVAYYGYYEVRLFAGSGDPHDPVIAAAARLQGTLTGWAHQVGGWGWLLALAVLLTAAGGWLWIRSARRNRAQHSGHQWSR